MSARHRLFRMASVVSIAIWCVLGAIAQANGSIAGLLRDANGVPLDGVRVTALPRGGGRTSYSTTDAAGRYRIANLSPGTYTIAAGPVSPHPSCRIPKSASPEMPAPEEARWRRLSAPMELLSFQGFRPASMR